MIRPYNTGRTLARLGLTVYTLILVYRYLTPVSGDGGGQLVGWLLHVGAFLVLGILVSWSFSQRFRRQRIRTILRIIVFGAVLEGLQLLIGSRFFSPIDLVMNAIGAGLAWFEPVIRDEVMGSREERDGQEPDIDPESINAGRPREEWKMYGDQGTQDR